MTKTKIGNFYTVKGSPDDISYIYIKGRTYDESIKENVWEAITLRRLESGINVLYTNDRWRDRSAKYFKEGSNAITFMRNFWQAVSQSLTIRREAE